MRALWTHHNMAEGIMAGMYRWSSGSYGRRNHGRYYTILKKPNCKETNHYLERTTLISLRVNIPNDLKDLPLNSTYWRSLRLLYWGPYFFLCVYFLYSFFLYWKQIVSHIIYPDYSSPSTPPSPSLSRLPSRSTSFLSLTRKEQASKR